MTIANTSKENEKQALLTLWQKLRVSSLGFEATLVEFFCQNLNALMELEILRNISDISSENAQTIEHYFAELSQKVRGLLKVNTPNFLEPTTYSALASRLVQTYAQEIYVIFIKYVSLCADQMGLTNKSFSEYNAFKQKINEFIETLGIIVDESVYNEKKNEFETLFKQMLNTWLEEKNPWQNPKLIYENSKSLEIMAGIIIENFEGIIDYEKSVKETLQKQEKDYKIIEAISDTLVIKIDNIKDSLSYFMGEIEEEVRSSEEDSDFVKDAQQMWMTQESITNIDAVNAFFNEVLDKSDITTKAMKVAERLVKKVSKLETNYKKEQLLLEITTFKELLNYSIERLKQSTDMDILMYVQVVEEANSMINTILAGVEIKTIDPPAGTMFNAKSHEVLMTQKEEGFKKGEILKVSNQGYEQNGQVLVRASVVVAR